MLKDSDYMKAYKEIEKYILQIDEDPSTDLGIFLKQLSEVNKYTQRVGTIVLKAIKNEQDYKELFAAVERAYEKAYGKIMTESEEIANKKSQAMRDAAASSFLEVEATALLEGKIALEKATNFRKIIERKLDLLRDSGDKLSRQITVTERMIDLGLLRRQAQDGE